MGVGSMSKCKCDLRTKLVGDGCRYCNAQEYIDKLIEALEEQRTWVGLTNEKVEKMWDFYKPSAFDFYVAIESELKAKNAE